MLSEVIPTAPVPPRDHHVSLTVTILKAPKRKELACNQRVFMKR